MAWRNEATERERERERVRREYLGRGSDLTTLAGYGVARQNFFVEEIAVAGQDLPNKFRGLRKAKEPGLRSSRIAVRVPVL